MPKGTFVKAGQPATAKWANDIVVDIRNNALGNEHRRDYLQYGFVPSFTPLRQDYVSGDWETTLQPGYVYEYRTNEAGTDGFAKLPIWWQATSGEDYVTMESYPDITLEKDKTLCVVYETDAYADGVVITAKSGEGANSGIQEKFPVLQWFDGIGEALDAVLIDENTSMIPENNDSEVLIEDPDERNGRYVLPVLSASGMTGVSGADNGMKIIPLNLNNFSHKSDWKFSHRDAYNTGNALQVLMVDENDQLNSQTQGEAFYLRTITGQESGSQMVRNPDKCAMVLEYAAETTPGEADTATIITGYNVLDDIDGSLTIKSGTTELGKIDWTDGMMDTDADVVVDLANLNKNRDGDTGDIILSEGGTPTTLISADNGVVDVITNTTIYVREYKVCESGTVVTKKFLCLD